MSSPSNKPNDFNEAQKERLEEYGLEINDQEDLEDALELEREGLLIKPPVQWEEDQFLSK